jgi:hypothetical protein
MTTITSLSQYLNSQTNSGSNSSSTSAFLSSAKAASTATSSTTSATADGDSVTLSAAAQALLAKSSSKTAKNYGFTLTAKQQEQLTAVLDKYKDKPQTQENYDAIQKDLKKYRLDTVNMAAKDSAKSFNIKSLMFSILSGKDVSSGTTERAQALATKKSTYAEQIVADWKTIREAATTTTTPAETTT